MRFAALYGHKWNSSYPSMHAIEIAKREWGQAIEKLTMEQIKRGLEHCKNHLEWPPSLAEFLKCSREDNTLPTINQAFREACMASDNHEWSHPAVYHAARDVGLYNLRTQAERYTRPLFERSYEIFCRRVKNGESLEVPIPKGLPEKTSIKSSKEVAEKYLQQMRAILKKGNFSENPNP